MRFKSIFSGLHGQSRSNISKATPHSSSRLEEDPKSSRPTDTNNQHKSKKTMAEADQELRERLEQLSGGGGASGIEYEDGKPQAMKRSVRNNMFRYI